MLKIFKVFHPSNKNTKNVFLFEITVLQLFTFLHSQVDFFFFCRYVRIDCVILEKISNVYVKDTNIYSWMTCHTVHRTYTINNFIVIFALHTMKILVEHGTPFGHVCTFIA